MPIIFGLDWRHPAVILNAISGVLYTIYFVMAIAVLELPHPRFPYAISIMGAAVMCALAIKATAEGDKGSVIVGYSLTALNVFASCGSALIIVSYLAGPESFLWHLMNFIPFPK